MSGASDPRTDAVLAKVDGDVQAIISSPEIARSYVIDKIRLERENAVLTASNRDLTSNVSNKTALLEEYREKLTALTARVAELERDAQRYRWLRDNPRGRSLSISALEWVTDPILCDAAIDAARGQG